MIKFLLWSAMHLTGLVMLIIIWGTDDVPTLIVPGVFGLIGGALYGSGTILLLLWAREGHR